MPALPTLIPWGEEGWTLLDIGYSPRLELTPWPGEMREAIAPTAELVEPLAVATVGPDQVLTFAVEDNVELAGVSIFLELGDGSPEWAYKRGAFSARYASSSIEVESETRWVFSLRRSGGWPAGPISVDLEVRDAAGNVS